MQGRGQSLLVGSMLVCIGFLTGAALSQVSRHWDDERPQNKRNTNQSRADGDAPARLRLVQPVETLSELHSPGQTSMIAGRVRIHDEGENHTDAAKLASDDVDGYWVTEQSDPMTETVNAESIADEFTNDLAKTTDLASASVSDGEFPPSAASSAVPAEILPPETAAPLSDAEVAEVEDVREIIRSEMPKAGEDEIALWAEELVGLPQEAVREIVRFRQRFGDSLLPGVTLGHIRAVQPGKASNRTPDRVERGTAEFNDRQFPADRSGMGNLSSDWQQANAIVSALRTAEAICLNNVANAVTVGFRRMRVTLVDLPYTSVTGQPAGDTADSDLAVGLGVQVGRSQLDQSQGRLDATGNVLDVAIVGDGYFCVQDPDDKRVYYTRLGQLQPDRENRLCIAVADRLFPLQPKIVLSDDIQIRRIDSGGRLRRSDDVDGEVVVDRIAVWRFPFGSELQPNGNSLLSETPASGVPQSGFPTEKGFGRLQSGHLEQSNVDVSSELAWLKRLRAIRSIVEQEFGGSAVSRSLVKVPPRPAVDGPQTVSQMGLKRAGDIHLETPEISPVSGSASDNDLP